MPQCDEHAYRAYVIGSEIRLQARLIIGANDDGDAIEAVRYRAVGSLLSATLAEVVQPLAARLRYVGLNRVETSPSSSANLSEVWQAHLQR